MGSDTNWGRYEQLRPDQLAAIVNTSPVAYWPLGLLEHHGWHLPVGFDGLKAERICIRIAQRTGGVVLPVMWWGGGGGHGAFPWTLYHHEDDYGPILESTARKLGDFGFRAVLVLAGHYPWQQVLAQCMPHVRNDYPDVLYLWGPEHTIAGDTVEIDGDHAAREETSFGLHLMPELVDIATLRGGRGHIDWPDGGPPPGADQHTGVCFDPDNPLFAQMGVDARQASAERGRAAIEVLVDYLARRINDHLAGQE